jgi:ribosome-associated protein
MPAKKTSTTKAAPAKRSSAKKAAEKAPSTAKTAPRAKKTPAPAPEIPTGPPEGLRLAELCCAYAADVKATNLLILDMRAISSVADFYVLCSGSSLPQLRAIRREIADRVWKDHQVKPTRMDGTPESLWIVADYSDVMVHVMHADVREKFSIEDLWSDAPRIPYRG